MRFEEYPLCYLVIYVGIIMISWVGMFIILASIDYQITEKIQDNCESVCNNKGLRFYAIEENDFGGKGCICVNNKGIKSYFVIDG